MKLSIVTTLYHSEKYIKEFYKRATSEAQKIAGQEYEIIMVDDGSPDRSLDIAIELTKNDHHVIVVELSRNFGHHKAMRAGLELAKGNLVFLLDSDLEEEPEWLSIFYQQLINQDLDVVYGVQEKRKGGFFEIVSGVVYYKLLNFLLNIQHPKNITTARLMRKKYVDSYLRFTETESVISCLWVITGFKQKSHVVKKLSHSDSTYSFMKKMSIAINTVTSFSTAPLRIIFILGIIITFFSFLFIIKIILGKIFWYKTIEGWVSIIVSIWFLGGLIISLIGILGLYLSKVFLEIKNRPSSIIRNIYGYRE